jgi:hypothetical protein
VYPDYSLAPKASPFLEIRPISGAVTPTRSAARRIIRPGQPAYDTAHHPERRLQTRPLKLAPFRLAVTRSAVATGSENLRLVGGRRGASQAVSRRGRA